MTRVRVRPALCSAAMAAGLLAPAAPAMADLHFSTPSRNIGCYAAPAFLRCDIQEATVRPPPKPRACRFDWGGAFSMAPRSRARRICHSDTVLRGPRVIPYGRTVRVGPFTCSVRRAGVRCVNRAGRGWSLSRERIRLF